MHSNKGRKRGFMVLLSAWVSVACAVGVAQAARAENGDGDKKTPPSSELAQAGMKAAATANLFRLQAGADAAAAVQKWGSAEFKLKWEKEIDSVFSKEERIELHDFFSSAVVWVGGMKGTQSIVAFYNPWSDGLFLAAMTVTEKTPSFTDFAFVSGESFRGEAVNPEASLALYELREPLIIAVARLYSRTVPLFTRLYPPVGDPVLLPEAVKARLEPQASELLPIKTRMMVRMKMFQTYFAEPNRPWVAECGALMKELKDSDPARLPAYLAENQDAAVAETVRLLPAFVRADLGPNYFAKAKDGIVVGLVNPAAPRWLIAATFKGPAPEKRAARIELLDLELSGKAVTLWKQEDKK